MTNDEKFMLEALKQAKKAAALGEVPVGAVIVRDDTVVSRAYNRRECDKNALRHAEITAIDRACKKLGGWRLCGCTLYVTLEPCPMCAGAIINSRIERVVYGCSDTKAGSVDTVQKMFELPYNHKPQLESGVLADDCSAMLSDFFRNLRKRKAKEKAE